MNSQAEDGFCALSAGSSRRISAWTEASSELSGLIKDNEVRSCGKRSGDGRALQFSAGEVFF